MEIERKFLVKNLPTEWETYPCCQIEQAYLSTEPVIRIRRKDDQYFLTCKGKGLLAREEYELELTREEYQNLLPKAEGHIISKCRYMIPHKGYTIELDVFSGRFDQLVVAEVEFASEEEANDFQLPEWFGKEVTYDPAYTNAALSKEDICKNDIIPGRYRHFKGNEYQVLCTAAHSETQEPMVVYRALYGERGTWVRPASMWNETVEREGKTFQRFTRVDNQGEN